METFHLAYAWHLPLQLTPDHIWLAILQGFTTHIYMNFETYRKKFVDFDGQKTLTVIRDEFVFGSPTNDWPGVFEEFAHQIRGYIGNSYHELLCADPFTTTAKTELAVYNLTLMDIMKKYFKYKLRCHCGIPKVRLLGTKQDWVKLIQKTSRLSEFDLEWWTGPLLEVLQKFADSYDGNPDPDFWKMSYKFCEGKGSGSYDSVEGWVNNFFPYVNSERSRHITPLKICAENFTAFRELQEGKITEDEFYEKGFRLQSGINNKRIPSSYSRVPFIWENLSKEIEMEFLGGLIGIEYTADKYIQPSIQWGVAKRVKRSDPKTDLGK